VASLRKGPLPHVVFQGRSRRSGNRSGFAAVCRRNGYSNWAPTGMPSYRDNSADRFIRGRLRTRARYADRRQNTETLEAMTQRLARHSHSLLPPRITEFLGQRVGVGDWGRFAAVYLKSICLHRLEPAERCNTLEIIRGRESSCNISIPFGFLSFLAAGEIHSSAVGNEFSATFLQFCEP